MKNILFIIPKNDVGGAPKFVMEQIDICNEYGFNCFLATNISGWINENESNKIQNILYDKKIERLFWIPFLFKLIGFIHKNKIKLVICNSANGGLYGRLAAFITGIGSVYVSHGWSSVYNGGKLSGILNFIERILSYIGTKVLCISNGDIEKANKFIHVPQRKLVQINNAIFPKNRKFSKDINTPLKLLTVARFKHPKRIDLLIEAIKNNSTIDLYIVGDGEDKKSTEKYIDYEEIKNVHLLGEIKDFNAYADYDIFILISESEGLPMSAIEAMSAGLPLVLSNVGGCPELINENGSLVENNVQSIVNGIEQCKLNYYFFANNSISNFNNNYNLHNRKNEFLHLYSQCIK
jgi:glycosyltransferase involved in cell wall biosynthesis